METGRCVTKEGQSVTSAIGNVADFRPEETPGGETWEEVMGSITSPVDAAVSHNVHMQRFEFRGRKENPRRFLSKFARLSRIKKWEISIIPVEAFSASTSFQTGKS